MASTNNTPTPSRRAMLGAFVLAPAAIAIGAPATAAFSDRSAWVACTSNQAALWKRLENHPAHRMSDDDVAAAAIFEDERQLCSIASDANDAVFETPAPDMAALVEKLELFAALYASSDGTEHIAHFIADVRRLGGAA